MSARFLILHCLNHVLTRVAEAACAALEAQSIVCWIAPRNVLAGLEYGEAIVDAISGCQIVVLIFSEPANSSPQVRREIERVVSKGKMIVPFRVEDVLPSHAMEYALSNTQWLDALSPPLEQHLPELCRTVTELTQRTPRAEALSQPQVPIRCDGCVACQDDSGGGRPG
jgi:hypothetical protein